MAFAGRPAEALTQTSLTDTNMLGRVDVLLHSQDSHRGVTDLRFQLTLRDGKLVGIGTAFVPFYVQVPYWVELQRSGS